MEQFDFDTGDSQREYINSGDAAYGVPAADNSSAPLSRRRSKPAMQGTNRTQPLPNSFPGWPIADESGLAGGGFGGGAKARKGSIRNAVRKIFGRRSREGSQEPDAPTSTSRHTYHKSEPTATLPPPQEVPEPSISPAEEIVPTSFPGPFPISSSLMARTGSPYAVQFPNSVKLKPLDLGSSFMPRSGAPQLKRRKTLSSLEVAEREAAALVASLQARESFNALRAKERPEDAYAYSLTHRASRIKTKRRQSRSADDLKSVVARDKSPVRKRSEEIRYWRESFQPDVLRASGFATRRAPEVTPAVEQVSDLRTASPQQEETEQREENRQPALVNMDNFSLPSRTETFRSSPPVRHGRGKSGSVSLGDSELLASSAFGTEMSKDLEDRVAKLEAGLQNFQRSLQRLTADRNRRTIIMGGVSAKRSSSDMRSPSLLADTLADPLDPASYQSYSYEQTALRPSTSMQQLQPEPQPETQPRPQMSRRIQPSPMEDPFGPEPAAAPSLKLAPPAERPADSFQFPSPLSSHPPAEQPPIPTSSSAPRNQPQPYTFSSLYQMLADERSARRKLESQLKGLQQEISELHSQVALSSNVQSTRSSYMLAGSSTRLQELLAGTESSPPGTASPSTHHDSGMSPASRPRRQLDPIVSRFSASESEAGTGGALDYDDLATPHEAYRTPREERSTHSLANRTDDGDMF